MKKEINIKQFQNIRKNYNSVSDTKITLIWTLGKN